VRLPLACLLLCLLAAALPASAAASAQITNLKVTPSTTQAGAHPDVTIDFSFSVSSGDDLKSLAAVLPQGLVGDPTAADRCSEANFQADSCPPSSQVGTQSATADLIVGPISTPQQLNGEVYNLQPHPGEPARLGAILRPPPPLAPIKLESGVSLGPATNFGLATKFDNLPRNASGLDTQVKAMSLTLKGTAAHGKFLTNPTSCHAATLTATITSYDAPGQSTKTASYTPTGCNKLPFQPSLSGSVGGKGQTAVGRSPELVAVVSARRGDANAKRVAVTLPPGVSVNFSSSIAPCSKPTFLAGNCSAGARVGTAVVRSPLLATPVTGPVLFVNDPATGQPALGVQFGPPVPLQLLGTVTIAGDQLTNTFGGVPDLPLSRFELTVNGGGTDHLLSNTSKLCGRKTPPLARATLLAHSGKTANIDAPLQVRGCTPGSTTTQGGGHSHPQARVSLAFKHKVGTLSARFRKAGTGPRLKRARLKLPTRLQTGARKGKLPRRLRVTADGHRVARKRIHLHGQLLDVKVKGAKEIRVRWGGLKPRRKLARRLKHRPKLTFVARLTDSKRHTTRFELTVRPSVRR
jgi:hypothetical protein